MLRAGRIIRRAHAHETETVEITWTLADGTLYRERHTCPPASVREARRRDEEYAQAIEHYITTTCGEARAARETGS